MKQTEQRLEGSTSCAYGSDGKLVKQSGMKTVDDSYDKETCLYRFGCKKYGESSIILKRFAYEIKKL
ncbi:MAG: hypothetical protein NC124_17730 [Clostridium sp.]|nr:hypothetical protein [Clostridium sp.]